MDTTTNTPTLLPYTPVPSDTYADTKPVAEPSSSSSGTSVWVIVGSIALIILFIGLCVYNHDLCIFFMISNLFFNN